MKNKISTFLTGFPDSVIGKQKNKKKRKEISSDPNEDILLLKRKKYSATDAKPNIITTISQVPAIDNKIIKKKENKIQAAPTSYCIEDIAVQDLKDQPPNTAGTAVSEIEKFVVPSPLPSYLTLFSSLKSNFNSPLPQLIKQRSTSTPIAGSGWQKLNFDIDPLTPVKEFIPSSLPKQTNIEFEVISEELPSQPIVSVNKKKCKIMLTSEKLKLGILDKIPKFCPFCDYVCERLLYLHIQTKHEEKLKLPISNSVVGINKIITNFSKNKKVLMPLQHIVDLMGDYWLNPEIRKIAYILCNLGQVTTYGGSWELNNVPEVSNPFEQYIVTSKP
ncbi:uncharacterized protein LOC100568620 isoform X2 [Acyrthosiphon pisum]|uniref:Uncharacterized protein n=1 Tax=Acyrthosiphon pisum TaxID=7029 RepID=A0A8R2A8Z8_ACYPI|nr:uncharacterized protein LOC100568620 isoform X2 [Acyrthosiphon pisum]|eukprot:XP_003247504.1 PREDICTED: uncharacterized protein LOC100568620 isoform X2 [Acyrthosiphon pisum]